MNHPNSGVDHPQKDEMIIELIDHLSCMMDYAGERCGQMIGFVASWKAANKCLEKAAELLPKDEQ